MGSINTGAPAIAMATSSKAGLLYVANGTTIRIFNYSSGLMVQSISASDTVMGMAVTPDGNSLYACMLNGTVARTSAITPGSFTTVYSNAARNWSNISFAASGNFYVTDNTDDLVYAMSPVSGVLNVAAMPGTVNGNQSVVRRTTNPNSTQFLLHNGSGNTMGYYNTNGGTIVFDGVGSSVGGFSTVTGLGEAHLGEYLAGMSSATSPVFRVNYYDEHGLMLRTWGSSVVRSPGKLAVAVAPEPGPIAAMVVGLSAIYARRRKSRR